jgi:hypothetical protein
MEDASESKETVDSHKPLYNDEEFAKFLFGEHYEPPPPPKKRYKRIRKGVPKTQRTYDWKTPPRKRKRKQQEETEVKKPRKRSHSFDVNILKRGKTFSERLVEVDLKVRPQPTDEVQEQVPISGS